LIYAKSIESDPIDSIDFLMGGLMVIAGAGLII
jgi:hypothetical protein